MQPALILADEPTGNLDRATGDEVVRLLEELNARGVTLIVVTHDAALGKRARAPLDMEDGMVRGDTRGRRGGLMRPVDTTRFALGAAAGNRLRTVLLMLAMSIGVAAVVVLTALGDGARRYVINEFSSLGTNLVIVLPGRTQTGGFSPQNVDHRHAARPDGRGRARACGARPPCGGSRRSWSAPPKSAAADGCASRSSSAPSPTTTRCATSGWRRAASCPRRTGPAARR